MPKWAGLYCAYMGGAILLTEMGAFLIVSLD